MSTGLFLVQPAHGSGQLDATHKSGWRPSVAVPGAGLRWPSSVLKPRGSEQHTRWAALVLRRSRMLCCKWAWVLQGQVFTNSAKNRLWQDSSEAQQQPYARPAAAEAAAMTSSSSRSSPVLGGSGFDLLTCPSLKLADTIENATARH